MSLDGNWSIKREGCTAATEVWINQIPSFLFIDAEHATSIGPIALFLG